jgi:hypothetical protein
MFWVVEEARSSCLKLYCERHFFVQEFVKNKMTKKKAERASHLTELDKALIINSYKEGIGVKTIAKQIQKSSNSIKQFYYRFNRDKDLPPKLVKSRTKITGRLPSIIKNMVLDNPKLGVRKLATKIRLDNPGLQW